MIFDTLVASAGRVVLEAAVKAPLSLVEEPITLGPDETYLEVDSADSKIQFFSYKYREEIALLTQLRVKATRKGSYVQYTGRLTTCRLLLEPEGGGPKLALDFREAKEAKLRGGIAGLMPRMGLQAPKICVRLRASDYDVSLRSAVGSFTARTVELLNSLIELAIARYG